MVSDADEARGVDSARSVCIIFSEEEMLIEENLFINSIVASNFEFENYELDIKLYLETFKYKERVTSLEKRNIKNDSGGYAV